MAFPFLLGASPAVAESGDDARVLVLGTDRLGTPENAFAYECSDLLVDVSGTLAIDEVASEAWQDRFAPNETRHQRIDAGRGAIWVRIRIRSELPDNHLYYVWVGWWGRVELFTPADGGFGVERSGAFVPVAERSVPEAKLSRHLVKLRVAAGAGEQTVYLRLQRDLNLSRTVLAPAFHSRLHPDFAKSSRRELLLDGLAIGVLAALALYHLVLFVLLRARVYLYFALAMLGRAWLFGVGRRLMLEFVWPGFPCLDFYLAWFGMPVFTFAFYLFLMSFLETRTRLPRTHRLLWGVMCLSFVSPILQWLRIPSVLEVDGVLRLVVAVVPLVVAAVVLGRRSKEALIFLLANVLMLAYFVVYALRMLGLDISGFVPPGGFYVGILLSAVLFSIAVAEQIRGLRGEREQIQRAEAQTEVLLHRQDIEAARLEARLRETRYEVLRSQLKPELLFASLDSIATTMRKDVDEAERLLTLLAATLREALGERGAGSR
jgi:hypothetical protein